MNKKQIIIISSVVGVIVIAVLLYFGLTGNEKQEVSAGSARNPWSPAPNPNTGNSTSVPDIDVPERPNGLSDELIKIILGKAKWYLNNSRSATQQKATKYNQTIEKAAIGRAVWDVKDEIPGQRSPVVDFVYNNYGKKL